MKSIMGKTEMNLLQEGITNKLGLVVVEYGYITSQRNMGYGRRRVNAANKLVLTGMLARLRCEKGIHQLSHRYGADHYSQIIYEITDKGRATAANG